MTSSQNAIPVTSCSLGGAAWPSGRAALLTRMSTPPSAAVASATRRADRRVLAGVDDDRDDPPAGLGGQLVGRLLEGGQVAGGDDDVAALGGERAGDGLADAAAAAGDEGPLAGQLEIHASRFARYGPAMAAFETPITLTGPWRSPVQMLQEQSHDGRLSVHDGDTAASLGLTGAPIEGPTHFSQFDPLAHTLWGDAWFERGCISSHFRTMVVEGEDVQASATRTAPDRATIHAYKPDGSPVLEGSISLGPDHPETALEARRARQGDPGELFIVDRLEVGMTLPEPYVDRIPATEWNGPLYPFSLAAKAAAITEPSPWYTGDSPWGGPIVPFEMLSVLANKSGRGFPVRGPALGLFLDLEVRMVAGPVLADHDYELQRTVIGLSQSKRTESYWTETTVTDPATRDVVAVVVLHQGVFKESFAAYPA